MLLSMYLSNVVVELKVVLLVVVGLVVDEVGLVVGLETKPVMSHQPFDETNN